jgi:predicted component of type VI protein secretion system
VKRQRRGTVSGCARANQFTCRQRHVGSMTNTSVHPVSTARARAHETTKGRDSTAGGEVGAGDLLPDDFHVGHVQAEQPHYHLCPPPPTNPTTKNRSVLHRALRGLGASLPLNRSSSARRQMSKSFVRHARRCAGVRASHSSSTPKYWRSNPARKLLRPTSAQALLLHLPGRGEVPVSFVGEPTENTPEDGRMEAELPVNERGEVEWQLFEEDTA